MWDRVRRGRDCRHSADARRPEFRLLDEIERQLRHQPAVETRRRKRLAGLEPPWEHVAPVWQLRVGDWRVFYDVDARSRRVVIRAVKKKGTKQTWEVL